MSIAVWEVSWSPFEEGGADSYNVYRQTEEHGQLTLVGSAQRTRITVELPGVESDVFVYIVPVIGGRELNEEEWTKIKINPTSLADINPPIDVADFSVAQDGDFLIASWTRNADIHLEEYEIRRGAGLWSEALKVATADKVATTVRWGWIGSGVQTYQIKAMTKQGQESPLPAIYPLEIILDGMQIPTGGTGVQEDPGWGGANDGMDVSGGVLDPLARAAIWQDQHTPANWQDWHGAPWWWSQEEQNPSYTTPGQDNGSVVVEVPHMDITYSPVERPGVGWEDWHGPYVRSEVDQETNGGGPRTDFDVTEFDYLKYESGTFSLALGTEVEIYLQLAQDAGETYGDVLRWIPGTAYRYRWIRFIIVLRCRTPLWAPRVSTMTWYRYRRNFKQEKSIEIIGTGGTVVTFDKSFTAIPIFTATALYVGVPYNVTVEQSGMTLNSCIVRAFDMGGVERSGVHVHVHALGV